MSKHLFPVLLLAVTFASCTKEIQTLHSAGLTDLILSPSSETKSSFQLGGESIVWTTGDRLSVLDGRGNRVFLTNSSSEDALFIGQVSSDATELTVVYPYNDQVTLESEKTVKAVLPQIQWAVPGKISDDAILSVGRTSVDIPRVSMKNVVGFVSMELPSDLEDVTRIDLSANGGEILSGILTIEFDGNAAPVVTASSGKPSISLYTPYAELEAGTYIFSANPVTMASGFTLTFHRKDGKTASLSSGQPNSILRNKFLRLGTIDTSSLIWSGEPTLPTTSIILDFAQWPFDTYSPNGKFPDTGGLYVTPETGCPYTFSGQGYLDSDSFIMASSRATLSLPAVPGARLTGVRHTASEESTKLYFTDIDGMPVSGRELKDKSSSTYYNIAGAPVSCSVILKTSAPTSISKLELIYESVVNSPEIISVGAYDGSAASFTFKNGNASDFSAGVEYIPSGSEDWSKANVIEGVVSSSTSSSAILSASLPSGAFKARAWARPISLGSDANRYGSLYYTPSASRILIIDFKDGVCFTRSGNEKGGEGTAESPRYGYDFPAAQQIADQQTGETTNGGSSIWGTYNNFTGYLTNYPLTRFNLTQDGQTYEFILGTGQGNYNAYLYRNGGEKSIYSNKAQFVIPGIEGFRIRSLVFNMSSSGTYCWRYGMGTSNNNLASKTNAVTRPEQELTTKNVYKDIVFGYPTNVPSGQKSTLFSNNVFYIKKMTIEYIKD